jgi:hypothetical protein
LDQPQSQQIHDFEPGIASNGLFWTIPSFPANQVQLNLGKATASMLATNLAISDYHDFFNSIGQVNPPIPVIPSTVTFAINWTGMGEPTELKDPTNGFAGLFIDSNAKLSWSAKQSSFTFVSDPASTSTTISGVIGQERNGRFAPGSK